MTILLSISAFGFLISFGSWEHFEKQRKVEKVTLESTAIGSLIITFIPLLSFIMLNLVLNKLVAIHWFWLLIASIIGIPLLSNPLTDMYSSILGVKTTKQIDLR